MKPRKLNVKLLRQIIQKIKDEPRRLAMSTWITHRNDGIWRDDKRGERLVIPDGLYGKKCPWHDFPPCGTAACIGGWAELITNKKAGKKVFAIELLNILGISDSQVRNLFSCDMWPEKYWLAYANAKTPKGKANAAIRYIEYFIKMKGNVNA